MISQKISRIEIRRRSRAFRQHGAVPGFPVALQPIEDGFLPILEIGPLAWVLNDIEQKFIAFDPQVLPVAVADSALRTGLVSPKELARVGRHPAGHDGPQVFAVGFNVASGVVPAAARSVGSQSIVIIT